MSEKDDTPNMTPLSSNSSGPSGTRAWNVSVADDHENPQPDKNSSASEQSESSVAPMTNNDHIDPEAAAADQPATEAFANEAAESFEAQTGQTFQDLPDPYDSGETDSQFTAPEATDDEDGTEPGKGGESADAQPTEALADESGSDEIGEQTTEELRQAVLDSMAQQEDEPEEALALFERISEDFSAMMATARTDAAAFSLKLMEFAQANAQSNFELARGYSSARSIPEIFNVQADYLKRQLELLNVQARELQALTAKVAAKNTMEIQNRRNPD